VGHGQCNSWTDFFLDVLRVQGVTHGFQRGIESTEGDGFLVKNWNFGTAKTFSGAPAGYNWKRDDNLSEGTSIPSQGAGGPVMHFGVHYVVIVGGAIYDPSYGGVPFSDLAAWEVSAIDGVWDGDPNAQFYAKKRVAGDTLVQWK